MKRQFEIRLADGSKQTIWADNHEEALNIIFDEMLFEVEEDLTDEQLEAQRQDEIIDAGRGK